MKLTRANYKAKKVTLSTQEKDTVVVVPIVLEKPYTEEEVIYNDIVKRYPKLGDFVKETGLVFVSSLEPPREIERVKKITQERAERGFKMMRIKGAIVRVENTVNRYRVNLVN